MAKGWNRIYTNSIDNDKDAVNEAKFNKTIRNTKKKTLDQLQKEFDDAFSKQKANEESLLAAYEGKILKSKTLIKRAAKLAKEKEQLNKKNAEDK